MAIRSNGARARQLATEIMSGLDSLSGGSGAVSGDSQTTVVGNSNAQEAIVAVSSARNTVLQSVASATTNLQKVASEFEAADQATRQLMAQTTLPGGL